MQDPLQTNEGQLLLSLLHAQTSECSKTVHQAPRIAPSSEKLGVARELGWAEASTSMSAGPPSSSSDTVLPPCSGLRARRCPPPAFAPPRLPLHWQLQYKTLGLLCYPLLAGQHLIAMTVSAHQKAGAPHPYTTSLSRRPTVRHGP